MPNIQILESFLVKRFVVGGNNDDALRELRQTFNNTEIREAVERLQNAGKLRIMAGTLEADRRKFKNENEGLSGRGPRSPVSSFRIDADRMPLLVPTSSKKGSSGRSAIRTPPRKKQREVKLSDSGTRPRERTSSSTTADSEDLVFTPSEPFKQEIIDKYVLGGNNENLVERLIRAGHTMYEIHVTITECLREGKLNSSIETRPAQEIMKDMKRKIAAGTLDPRRFVLYYGREYTVGLLRRVGYREKLPRASQMFGNIRKPGKHPRI